MLLSATIQKVSFLVKGGAKVFKRNKALTLSDPSQIRFHNVRWEARVNPLLGPIARTQARKVAPGDVVAVPAL